MAGHAQLDYFRFLQKYSSVFGQEHIVVRPYKKGRKFNIFKNFLRAANCNWRDDLEVPPKSLNTRFSWVYLRMLWYANKSQGARKLMLNRRIKKIARFSEHCLPSLFCMARPLKEERERLMQEYEDSNSRVAAEYLGRDQLFV